MTIRKSASPYGYRNLLVYKKAEELQHACASLTSHFPREKTLIALADQMDRSARSVKQNIVEGWKRNSTKEYYDFLGFSLGANAELEEDCNDIIKGMYEMGGRGIKGEKGWDLENVEKLHFYPLDSRLPEIVQLKLRCKELNMLLSKLQKSLVEKMESENRLPLVERQLEARRREDAFDDWIKRRLQEEKVRGEERDEKGE